MAEKEKVCRVTVFGEAKCEPVKVEPVKLFVQRGCAYCNDTRQLLRSEHVKFTEINVEANPERARRIFKKAHARGTPILETPKSIVVGFDADAIKQAIAKEKR